MNAPCSRARPALRVIAVVMLIGGAGLSAPPLAHAVNGAVSAARAKAIWSEWKRAFGRRAGADAASLGPGKPAFWLRVPKCRINLLTLQESDSTALYRFPAVRRLENGGIVVSAHRDMHFRPLQRIQPNDLLMLESANGRTVRYKVRAVRILLPEQVPARVEDPECRDAVHLLTCYPFQYFGAAPQRFLVTAYPID